MNALCIIVTVLLFVTSSSYALDNQERAAAEPAASLGCHDFAPRWTASPTLPFF
tara:strand:- start:712 stop:873 length:162 start_codon:yes stop_codon:yes gene_type:complete